MPTGDTALVPLDVRTVEFYGDTITGALVRVGDEAQVFVPIRPICDYLGLAWSGQFERIKRDEVLSEAIKGVRVTRTPQEGGTQEMICLPLEMLPGFLFGVNAARVKTELREKIIQYRRECYRRLWDVFKHDILPATELAPRPGQSGAQVAYELATAVANLAREQMEAEQRLGARLDRSAVWAKQTDQRITALELRLGDDEQITEAQAAELALAVKTVANALAQQGAANGYPVVYGQLYRRFSIASYKSMPRRRLNEALDWLRGWLGEIEAQTKTESGTE